MDFWPLRLVTNMPIIILRSCQDIQIDGPLFLFNGALLVVVEGGEFLQHNVLSL